MPSFYIQTPQRQRGAFSIMAGVVLMLLVVTLGLVTDSGRLYFEKRRLQKTADFAALEAVARLPDGSCASDPSAATGFALSNAAQNGFITDATQQLRLICITPVVSGGIYQPPSNADVGGRAVWVALEKTVPASLVQRSMGWFGVEIDDTITLTAEAVAQREEPTASFSVASQLLQLDNGLLQALLRAVGLNLDLSLLDRNGLASLTTTPAGLLSALGIDLDIQQLKALSPQGLLDLVESDVGLLTLDDVVDTLLSTVASGNTFGLDALLGNLSGLANSSIKLFGVEGDKALLMLDGSVEQLGSSLDTMINIEQLLSAALLIGVQDQERGLQIPGLNAAGLLQAEVGIVEPPAIGIGPEGTKAYNAQVRLYLDIDTSSLLSGSLKWLTEDILGTRVHLPVWIDLVAAQGTLQEIDCSAPEPTAQIIVESDILKACVGEVLEPRRWSGSLACEASNLKETQLIELLHLPVLSGKLVIDGLPDDYSTPRLGAGDIHDHTNPVALGNTVTDLVAGLLDLLSGLFRQPNTAGLTYSPSAKNQLISQLATQYLDESADSAGFYNVQNVLKLLLQGGNELDANGNQVMPPLVPSDWQIPKIMPKSCVVTFCSESTWSDGTFSGAFKAYTSTPYGVLDILGVTTFPNGYQSCAGLLRALLAWNPCVKHNLTKFLQEKPDGLNLSQPADGSSVVDSSTNNVNCSGAGALCTLLKPMLTTALKPVLNGVGALLNTILGNGLGLELGRTEVEVHAISCGAPALLR